MNQKEARKKIKNLTEEILAANEAYYVNDEPILSDAKYDLKLRELEKLEKEFPNLALESSPIKTVGSKLKQSTFCLLYTSPSPRDQRGSRMPSSA